MRRWAATSAAIAALFACRFDPAYRDVPDPHPPACSVGEQRCAGAELQTCVANGGANAWARTEDCGARGLACAPTLLACTTCVPGARRCDGQVVAVCDAQGADYAPERTCDVANGEACRAGGCANLCGQADEQRSNIGCEYWGVDLDNANVGPTLDAAAQQYAIVVSNAQPDVPASVVVEEDDSVPGATAAVRVVATAVVAPLNLEVFKLGPREVDGSADGTFNTGTGTALTRHAYRVRASVPIVAYQFNPLENVNVFSNDASQLLPVSALNAGQGRAYVVVGWPQTIATSSVPSQNFGLDLRATLAIVGTRPDTHVHVKTTARIIPGGPFAEEVPAGSEVDAVLQPFEVLNLETGDFDADFTGSLVDSDQPVAVFPGSEASDAPYFTKLADRFCCADHLEDQAPPVRTIGKQYVIGRMPDRTRAVAAAGGHVGIVDEPEFYRVARAAPGPTHVTTTLPPPYDAFDLADEGDFVTIAAHQDFLLGADAAVLVSDVQASQEAAGIVRGLPGGDPSLTFVAPVEQWRADYVLLTPDKYSFDFLVVTAPFGAHVFVDGLPVGPDVCEVAPADGLDAATRGAPDPPYLVYRCQLSFPVIDPTLPPPKNLSPGRQNDGVHRVQADLPVGVIAYGFDSFVSYAYTGGTQLTEINVR